MGAKENTEERDERSRDLEKERRQGKEEESDLESARDSISSQGESQNNEDNKVKKTSRVPHKFTQKQSADGGSRASRVNSDRKDSGKLQFKASTNGQSRTPKPNKATSTPKNLNNGKKSESTMVPSRPPSDSSEGSDDKSVEEAKKIDSLDEASNCDVSVGTDDETGVTGENTLDDDRIDVHQKMEVMKLRMEKLEEELREVAALEISLYSVVPEHGSSSHKVHTPARRLSRLYIHACKHWSQDKRATVARNTVSGLVLIAKACGNDASRLTFWLSNTIVLREIVSQTFGHFSYSNPNLNVGESNGVTRIEGKSSPLRRKNNNGCKHTERPGFMHRVNDWQETSTFITALEKVESWIFSRTVESVWWQSFNPHMHSLVEEFYTKKSSGRMSGPALGDQEQGNLSIEIWKAAFHDASTRICPVRGGGHECGCLPVLAKMVMEQCVSRLDVAMFNAILRESDSEIPTDPVSDPIVDAKVLPIPAGILSFSSGAQLKNSIGNWSRLLADLFGMDEEDLIGDDQNDDVRRHDNRDSKSFCLLNELSDLLMLPKDMLLDSNIRNEVCPSIGMSVVTRVLCNFTPDEFCLDPVPGHVLEQLNCESMLEQCSLEKDLINTFPRPAALVVYLPPSPADVAEKVAEIGGRAELERRVSMVQKKGYTSDEDLDDLDSPLSSVINKTQVSSPVGVETQNGSTGPNERYKLLREVWSD